MNRSTQISAITTWLYNTTLSFRNNENYCKLQMVKLQNGKIKKNNFAIYFDL